MTTPGERLRVVVVIVCAPLVALSVAGMPLATTLLVSFLVGLVIALTVVWIARG